MPGKVINIFLFLLVSSRLYPQTGGDNVYEFLNLTHSGLISSMGGVNVSLISGDLNLSYHNPALLNSEMDKSLALNYVNYLAGINYGFAGYARTIEGKGNFAAGIAYLNYGSFTEADASGNITGTFRAAEYALSLTWSKELDTLFSFGFSLKPILSHLESYTSIGMALDAGCSWQSRKGLFSAGIVIKNIGLQLTTYAGENREKLPFEIQAGITRRLAHAPFRFSLTGRHLEKFDLTHSYIAGADQKKGEFAENILRHLILSTEVLPHRNFYISAGYNYQRRRELQVESRVSGAGISWGFGLNTSFLSLGFGRASFHLAGASNHVSLILRPDLIYHKLRK